MRKRIFPKGPMIPPVRCNKARWLLVALLFSPLTLVYHCGGGGEETSTSVSGRITTSDGRGVSGLTVQASTPNAPGCGGYRTGITDANGIYLISSTEYDPSMGEILVAPPDTSSGYWFDPPGRTVTISYGVHLWGLDFKAIVVHFVSGRITDSNGVGIPNVMVNLMKGDTVFATVMTEGEPVPLPDRQAGDYWFSNVPTGTYTIIPTGFVFNPVSRTVTVVEGEPYSGPSGQDFVLQ